MAGETTIAGLQTEVDLDALIGELDAAMDYLPEEALRTCQRHRELVTPRLIDVLAEAARLGREGTAREGNAHFFALFLLAEFQAKEALPVILEIYSLPEHVLDELVGDAITELSGRVLAVLAGDQPDAIEALAASPQISQFVRWGAALALGRLVRDERMSREECVRRLAGLMRAAVAAEDHWGTTITVNELGNLNPLEVQDEIKSAFDRGFVDESIVSWKDFHSRLLFPDQPGACPELSHGRPSAIADTVQELSGWYCFSEEYRRAIRAAQAREAGKGLDLLDEDDVWQGGDEDDESYDRDEGESGGVSPLSSESTPPASITIRNEGPRIGRNDPCPCGSGKKYKKCCLRAVGNG